MSNSPLYSQRPAPSQSKAKPQSHQQRAHPRGPPKELRKLRGEALQACASKSTSKELVLVVLQKTVEFRGEFAGLLLVDFSEPGLLQAKFPNPPAKSSSLWSFKKLWNLEANSRDCYWWTLASPAFSKPSFQIHQQRARPCGPSKNCGI